MMNLNYEMDRIPYQIFNIILSIFKKTHGESVDKPSVWIYVNKIENRVTFKIKNWYSLEPLHQRQNYMKLLESTCKHQK